MGAVAKPIHTLKLKGESHNLCLLANGDVVLSQPTAQVFRWATQRLEPFSAHVGRAKVVNAGANLLTDTGVVLSGDGRVVRTLKLHRRGTPSLVVSNDEGTRALFGWDPLSERPGFEVLDLSKGTSLLTHAPATGANTAVFVGDDALVFLRDQVLTVSGKKVKATPLRGLKTVRCTPHVRDGRLLVRSWVDGEQGVTMLSVPGLRRLGTFRAEYDSWCFGPDARSVYVERDGEVSLEAVDEPVTTRWVRPRKTPVASSLLHPEGVLVCTTGSWLELHDVRNTAALKRQARVARAKPRSMAPRAPQRDVAAMAAEWRAALFSDPAPRERLQVYADWLEELGEASRAEYIRLKTLAAPTPAQRKRASALEKKDRGVWLGAAPLRSRVGRTPEPPELRGVGDLRPGGSGGRLRRAPGAGAGDRHQSVVAAG